MNNPANDVDTSIRIQSAPVLLLVDDEPNVLSSLNRMLHGEGYLVKMAESAAEGLKVLEEHSVQVIISDHNMPGMTGVEFLAKVKMLYPATIRILLTAESDVGLLSEAVNKGDIYKFLVKPWDMQMLKANISEAFHQYDLTVQQNKLAADIKVANNELASINQVLQNQLIEKSSELVKISQFDSITGLPNRMLFSDRLSQQMIQADDSENKLHVVIIGIDKFGRVNETYGHAVGDWVMQAIGEKLTRVVAQVGSIARIGSDEFAIVFSGSSADKLVADYLHSLFSEFERPIRHLDNELYLTLSAGICSYPDDAQTVDGLIKNATTAMHFSKKNIGNSYHFYSSSMQLKASKRLMLENKLRQALEKKEYLLHYQPQQEISTRRFVGVEALLRWQTEDGKIIGPDVFIPILEETDMIIQVGEWVLRETMHQAIRWHAMGITIPVVSVNLSPRQFKMKDLVNTVSSLIHETGFDKLDCKLEIEITESVLAEDVEIAISILNQISDLGVRIAMDDFGTGYASLNYITQFPVDTLKIDRSFIGRVDNNIEDQAIVRAIITMAHSLNMLVVAEGVETNEQLDFLKSLSCDVIQGFLFNKPVTADSIVSIYNGMNS